MDCAGCAMYSGKSKLPWSSSRSVSTMCTLPPRFATISDCPSYVPAAALTGWALVTPGLGLYGSIQRS